MGQACLPHDEAGGEQYIISVVEFCIVFMCHGKACGMPSLCSGAVEARFLAFRVFHIAPRVKIIWLCVNLPDDAGIYCRPRVRTRRALQHS